MSLYNMFFGMNPLSGVLLSVLGLEPEDVGRLRDAFVTRSDSNELQIAVYTRNGGGNREHYDDDMEAGDDCRCTGCIATYWLPSHELYVSDRDDDFDNTYATFYFKVPDRYITALSDLADGNFNPDKRWLEKLKEIESPDYKLPKEMVELIDKLNEALTSGKGGIVKV